MFFELVLSTLQTKIVPLLLAIIGFCSLIAFHELGHFLMCKLFGIATPTFSIGFGPELFSRKIGTTLFRVAAIPLGGYVEIAGLAEEGQGGQKQAQDRSSRSFNQKPYWQKFLVLLGGIFFNMIFAYVTFSTLYFVGIPKEKAQVMVQSVEDKSPAERGGLQKGDMLVGIDDTQLSAQPRELMQEVQGVLLKTIAERPNASVSLHIRRDAKDKDLKVKLGSKEVDGKTIGSLGVSFGIDLSSIPGEYERFSFTESIKMGVSRAHAYALQVFGFLKSMVSQRSLKGAGGPIMILSASFNMAKRGFSLLLVFLAIISINLAVLNVLPLGILDGGRLLFVTIETIIRREIPEKVRLTVDLCFWLFFLALVLVLSYRDILWLLR